MMPGPRWKMRHECETLEGYPLSAGWPMQHPADALGAIKALIQEHGLMSPEVSAKILRLEEHLAVAVRHHNAMLQFRMLFDGRHRSKQPPLDNDEPHTAVAASLIQERQLLEERIDHRVVADCAQLLTELSTLADRMPAN